MADPTPAPSPLVAIASQARALWQRLPGRARVVAIATVVAIVGGLAVLALRPGPGPWQPVVEQIAPADAAELGALLAAHDIPHRFGKRGRIEVPAGELAAARVVAASAGLPRGGVGFELFDGVKLGQSSFAEQVNYRRAMEGELARSIATLAPVESARVHVALGKRSVFKDVDEPPTASVVVRLRAGQTLSPLQVQGVRNLVAASIDGLVADQVMVIDQHGSALSADGRERTDDAAQIERGVAAQVRAMLETALGVGRVEVVVRADVDRSKVTKSEELYDPAATALRSESRQGQASAAGTPPVGGIAGVQGNLPGAAAATTAPGAAPGAVESVTRNFEISRTLLQTEEAPLRVKKLQVAILVDYRAVDGGAPAPLPAAELEQYAAIARAAAGLDDARGDKLEIRSVPFAIDAPTVAATPARRGLPLPVPLPIILGGAAAVAVVVVLVLARRRRARAAIAATPTLALPASLAEVERALDAPSGDSMPALPPPADRSLEERVLAAVNSDLPRAARVLASWLGGPDPEPAPAKGVKS